MSTANTADHTRRGMTAGDQSLRLEAARQPTDIPRNVASNVMYVKNVRNTTVLPNHLMHANSKKRSRKLTTNNSTYGRAAELRRNGMYRDNVSMLMGLVTRCLSRRNQLIDEVAGPAISRALCAFTQVLNISGDTCRVRPSDISVGASPCFTDSR